MDGNVYIRIDPEYSLVDVETKIRVFNLEPNQELTLKVCAQNYSKINIKGFNPSKWVQERQWESWGVFRANNEGIVDLSNQAPLAGTYSTKDAMGLLWSMKYKESELYSRSQYLNVTPIPDYMNLNIIAQVEGHKIAESECIRLFKFPSVKSQDVTECGIVGRFFFIPDSPSKRGIIVLGGSEGGIDTAQSYAALLASHGYPSLALAYYNMDSLPYTLENIPLEYFENAIEWMKSRPEIKDKELTLFGKSRGGEAALLIASLYKDIKSVIAIVPSPIIFMGSDSSGKPTHVSAWSRDNTSFPFLDSKFDCNFYLSALINTILQKPVHVENFYLKTLKNKDMVDKAFIPIEKINGPILFISGDADTIWPSNILCKLAIERLNKFKFQFEYKHLNYHNAGHSITYPFLPIVETANVQDLAFANKDNWANILNFLK